MNKFWIRSEDGTWLALVDNVGVKETNFGLYLLITDTPENGRFEDLASYQTKEAAIRQLDDIQLWLRTSARGVGRIEGEDATNTYDLRLRKTKESWEE